MDIGLLKDIATIASPIIGTIAIIVALYVSHRASRDAQKQIDAQRKLLEVFMAAQAPTMMEALQQYQKQLKDLDSQIDKAQQEYDVVNPFMYQPGGAPIDKIDYFEEKKRQKQTLDKLKRQRQEIVSQIELIKSFLNK